MSVIKKIKIGTGTATDIGVDWSNISNKPSLATLGSDGKVPSSQLPSYVDDVLEYASKVNFPTTGESGKIYIDKTTNLTYRWSGTTYIEISASLALGETDSTAYPGSSGKANAEAINAHRTNTSNPHNVTKAQVGLEKVDNTADKDKPISTAVQTALNKKSDTTHTHKYAGSSSVGGNANKANTVALTEGTADAARFVIFQDSSNNESTLTPCYDADFKYNPVTNILTAGTFKGSLDGNATSANTATKATQDILGNNISETYATKSELETALGNVESLLAAI